MSPGRGDRVTVSPPPDKWDVRFGPKSAVTGWEELCRYALANARHCLEVLQAEPRWGASPERQHRLRGDLATHRHNGKDLEQWECEVTSGGRVRYVIDDQARTVWLILGARGTTAIYPGFREPADIERAARLSSLRRGILSSR